MIEYNDLLSLFIRLLYDLYTEIISVIYLEFAHNSDSAWKSIINKNIELVITILYYLYENLMQINCCPIILRLPIVYNCK